LGWDSPPAEFGITTLVLWPSATGRPHIFDENTLSDAAELLSSADCILSFNGVKFDLPIIEGIMGEKVQIREHLDLLQLIWAATGEYGSHKGGYKLTECCERSLGIAKNGDGALAPALAEQGRWCELIDYCLHDVYLTRKLFKYAQKHGGITSPDGEILKLDFPDWFQELTI
jgi:uncharacterized protein YprB with RNaseH-like and TPR domain